MAVGLVLLSASPASALYKAIWGPVDFQGQSEFPDYNALHVGIYQHALYWNSIAPTRPAAPRDPNDPAYHWPADLDEAAQQAATYHMRILLMVLFSPRWATPSGDPTMPPKPGDYADFVEAAARRYPSVHLWMVWGEPNRRPNYFLHGPLSGDFYYQRGKHRAPPPFNAAQRADDRKYAELVDATYGRLKKLDRRNLIIGGNTTTSGEVDPENWIRYMRLRDGRPPRMDLYGHNPYTSRKPDLRNKQLQPNTADFSDLDTLAGWLDRWLDRAGRDHRLRIFISEFTVPTDVPCWWFPLHATRKVQAEWAAAGLRIARHWKRIYSFAWNSMRDQPPLPDGRDCHDGLIDAHGVRKPAFYAFARG